MFLRQSGYVETGTCYTIRKLGFQKLQELPFSYYDRMPVGYLMSRLTNDTQRLADTIGWSLLDLCWGAVFLVCCSIQMFLLNSASGAGGHSGAAARWQSSLGNSRKAFWPPTARCARPTAKSPPASTRASTGAKTTKTLVREKMNIAGVQRGCR